MQDLAAEQIDFMIEPASNFRALISAGDVKPFAVTGRKRLPALPNVPTTEEAGLPDISTLLSYGLWIPKGTPRGITAKLNAAMTQIMFDPQGRQRFDELGIEIAA